MPVRRTGLFGQSAYSRTQPNGCLQAKDVEDY
jgi:hypothetical protein